MYLVKENKSINKSYYIQKYMYTHTHTTCSAGHLFVKHFVYRFFSLAFPPFHDVTWLRVRVRVKGGDL